MQDISGKVKKTAEYHPLPHWKKICGNCWDNSFAEMHNAEQQKRKGDGHGKEYTNRQNKETEILFVRLGEGESLEAVRKDFAAEFQGMEASEIMIAEEAIQAEGTPITEVQKLCDALTKLIDRMKELLAGMEKESSNGSLSETTAMLLEIREVAKLLNTIPLENSFIDAEDRNCYFNEGPKVFKRAQMALGRSVFTCHPPKVEAMVRRIIGEFRKGTLDRVPVWMDKGGRTMLVTYMAVRDENGEYMGTIELVQDMEFAKEYFSKLRKRILSKR